MKNRSGSDFAQTVDGHYDLCAALMYFVRGLSITTNRYPHDFDKLTGRKMPDHHPLMVRRAALGETLELRGLAGAILSGNDYVRAQLAKRRRYGP